METITSMRQLASLLPLTDEEKAFDETKPHLPLKISGYYFSLIDKNDPNDPIRRQAVPSKGEQEQRKWEDIDPLEEQGHSVTNRLIHRYKSRVAFLTTDLCPSYCRHCFRRRFTGTFQGPASRKEIEEAAIYCGNHKEVTEILFTGGDMMTLDDDAIDTMVTLFREQRPDLIIRLCTRICATDPKRITSALVQRITRHDSAPFFLMTQFNHPRELTEEAKRATSLFIDHGIPAMNQTVLLHGVNDDADTLEELCNKLLSFRIKPYYLFQGDLVEGTDRFRVPLEKGMAIEQELRRRLSGLAMPAYTADLPHGGGKIPLCQDYLVSHKDGEWTFRTPEGERRHYHDPME